MLVKTVILTLFFFVLPALAFSMPLPLSGPLSESLTVAPVASLAMQKVLPECDRTANSGQVSRAPCL